jgi:hypothetical protein
VKVRVRVMLRVSVRFSLMFIIIVIAKVRISIFSIFRFFIWLGLILCFALF